MISPADYLLAAASYALATGGTYLRENGEQATIDTSALPAPFIILCDYATKQNQLDVCVQTAQVTLYFADVRPGPGDSPAFHLATVERMLALQRLFVTALDTSDQIKIEALNLSAFRSAYEAQLDGVGVQFLVTIPTVALVPSCIPGFTIYMPAPLPAGQQPAVVFMAES